MLSAFDYQNILRRELRNREQYNPRYSLRSFSKELGISAARLSEILNNNKGTSRKTAELMAENLGLTPKEKKVFILSVEAQHSKSAYTREQARHMLQECMQDSKDIRLKEDEFRLIADWYHLAIMELLNTTKIINSPKCIQKFLDISEQDASDALKRLMYLGYIEKQNGTFIKKVKALKTAYDIPNEARRSHQFQISKLSQKALLYQDPALRELGSNTVAFNSDKLEKVKQLIREFRKKIADIGDEDHFNDKVYVLNTQFFSLLKEDYHETIH